MKKGIKSFLVYFLIAFLVLKIFEEGIKVPGLTIYLIGTLALLSLTIMAVCPFLTFLTVKCKFLSFTLMSSLLLFGVFFLLKMFMTDFYIQDFQFYGLEVGSILIKGFMVTPIVTIGITSLVISILAGIFRGLDGE